MLSLLLVKSTMLLLLIIAGLSLTGHGLLSLLEDFFWGNLLEVVSVFILMVFFPALYLWNLIANYKFWQYKEIDQLIRELTAKFRENPNSCDSIKMIKKGKSYFTVFVKGLHTKFIFSYFRKDKLEITDIQKTISIAKEIGTENILIFCTGTVSKEAKELVKNSAYSIEIEDYRSKGDFNLKRYFTAPMKMNKKIA